MDEVEGLKRDLRAAQELLFSVLLAVGEPVTFEIDATKVALNSDKAIVADLNQEEGTWTIYVSEVE